MSAKPNIIYILSDQHRGQAMSHMGDPNIKTPHMDRLGAEGVSFKRAYANCPVCTPSRGTIFSGRHAHSGPISGFFNNWIAAGPSAATILRQEGYHTAYFGKWHGGIVRNQIPKMVREEWKTDGGGFARTPERHRAGFQDWFGYECINKHFKSFVYKGRDINPTPLDKYESDGLTDMAIEYMQNYDRSNPLFMVLSINPPHFPFEVPEEFRRLDPKELKVQPNFLSENPEWREALATYYAMVENLDWNIGRFMDALKEIPEFSDTLVVYVSDHGDYIGSHDIFCGKVHPHEESTRIPAIFHWPGKISPQENSRELFSLVDLLPTTLGLAGLTIPSHIQGMDFSPHLRGESFTGPDQVLLEMVGNPRWRLALLDWRGIVTADWKYAFYETGEELLFDLNNDPYEMTNLAGSRPEVCTEMKKRLLEELRRTKEPYFDVVLEYGVPPDYPDIDVEKEEMES